ncbi:DNA helicase RecQ [Exilibacterium tricleocarpae]|uniref:DNA helicase RecQ n=1 Tax=Exilibacterium tricleocarpae TaxID=2591008 RepID=A0A545TLH1_9GAMM|nr:DNA helicase RecQ [Exilibacterium tricleocarpae]TQV78075.1 DNA helicase RecQ [Exilibacterium tricleocarpae]
MQNHALDILQNTFGFHAFRAPQDQIVDTVVNGDDALVIMPTGGGKSLCYQIPALVRPGTGVVISPLIALMHDQVASLQQLGIRAAYLNSSLDPGTAAAVEAQLRAGQLDLLYIAPERLIQARTQGLLGACKVALFAIDEAHCVSQWGHDFRSDYLSLDLLPRQFPGIPRIALTATADERTRQEIIERLHLQTGRQFCCGFDRPNIQYRITQKNNARQQLLRFIHNEHPRDAGIVYCLSRRKVEATAEWLQGQGYTALAYHAGLGADQRRRHQERFLREEGVIIVATVAFGMGIDKPDVRFVAHLDLPKSIEAYYQETGRAGRDGEPATAWMVYGIQDVVKLRQMLETSQGSEQHKRVERHKLDAMLGLCEITSCRRQALLHYFGEETPDACGNCDTCLTPVQTWDGTVAAQKALSCAYRTGQRFGVNHLIDVLVGKETDKVRQFSHQQLSTYGVGADLDTGQWRSVYRQLVARGYLTVDMGGFGSLRLTERCRVVLRGEENLALRRDPTEQKVRKQRGSSHQLSGDDGLLWDALRACRKKMAEDQNVPPYVIFHDATLMELVAYRPANPDQFARINGVGQSKLEKYSDAFLEVIRRHEAGGDDSQVAPPHTLAGSPE